ncbi:flap endonuclease Xni [Ferrimonas gelatinilytica]|uniref:Flap endonuclease Xni n=1 Tax=Ferrimonas gelatinilytica TaxID=1255257 RepID=A0ABP9RSG6_9GAMM
MTVHLLLIDALNLIRRIHATAQDNPEALQERCLAAVNKALRQHRPSHAILVWDGGHQNSWRKELYPDYKAHRKPMPEDLAAQLPTLKQQLNALGVGSVELPDIEADDLIATIAVKVVNHDGQVLILSTDQGFGQLLRPGIRQWDHFEGHPIDADRLQQKLGVRPEQLLEFWALAGDSGNGIPGVPGIGKKTAQTLLAEHGSLANIFSEGAVVGKLGERLANHKAQARLSYALVRLRQDLTLNLNLAQFRLKENL